MSDTPANPDDAPEATGTARRRRSDASRWYWLLLVPIVLLAYPPMYNRADPELGGLPFFYWYQLAVVPIGVACTAVAYLKTRANGADR